MRYFDTFQTLLLRKDVLSAGQCRPVDAATASQFCAPGEKGCMQMMVYDACPVLTTVSIIVDIFLSKTIVV